MSMRIEAAALASVTVYLDELTVFFEIHIHCKFLLYVDSTSAITNVKNLVTLYRSEGMQTMRTFCRLWQLRIRSSSASLWCM